MPNSSRSRGLDDGEAGNGKSHRTSRRFGSAHGGSKALLALALVNFGLCAFAARYLSSEDQMLAWAKPVIYGSLYFWSLANPVAATGTALVVALINVMLAASAPGPGNLGMAMTWLGMLAASHAGFRRQVGMEATSKRAAAIKRLPVPAARATRVIESPDPRAADRTLTALQPRGIGLAVFWSIMAALAAAKMAIELAILTFVKLGGDLAPSVLADIILFPRLGDISLLPICYPPGIPGAGLVIMLLLVRNAQQLWADHAQRVAIRSGGYALYLRSFTDDEEKPGAWQLLVDTLSNSVGGLKRSVSTRYAHSTEVAAVRTLLHAGIGSIAVRSAGDNSSRIGALRVALPAGNWKSGVLSLMRRARLIVLRLRLTPGTHWELYALLQESYRDRALVVFENDCFPALLAATDSMGLGLSSTSRVPDTSAGIYIPATGQVRVLAPDTAVLDRNKALSAEVQGWVASKCRPGSVRSEWTHKLFGLLGPVAFVMALLIVALQYPMAIIRSVDVAEMSVDQLLERPLDGQAWAVRVNDMQWPSDDIPAALRPDPFGIGREIAYVMYPKTSENGRRLVFKVRRQKWSASRALPLGSVMTVALRRRWFEGVPEDVQTILVLNGATGVVLCEAVEVQDTVAGARNTLLVVGGIAGVAIVITFVACLVQYRRRKAARRDAGARAAP